jgi:cell division protein FtsB
MFANKIAGASVAFAIGLASAEFAKSLTLKAVIPFLQRLLQWLGVHAIFGRISAYDFGDVSTMGLYWICMIGVSYFISEYIFGRFLLGTATVLSKDEKQTMKAAQKAVLQEPSTLQVVKNTVSTITGREGFEEEKSSVDFDNELLPRD